jgi:acid phosphatase family membrane protein YuiD
LILAGITQMMSQTPLTAVLLAAAAAGKQAEVLNQVIGELLDGHPVSDVKLKEVLGHTPLQVRDGAARMGRGHVHSWLCW